MKGLPLSYNRDMQEDKEPLFDAADTVKMCLRINAEMLRGAKFRKENMERALAGGFVTATDMADYLARGGVPFRAAHETVGIIVAHAEKNKKELWELSLSELRKFSKKIGEDVFDVITVSGSVESRTSAGGTATANVKKEISRARKFLRKCM